MRKLTKIATAALVAAAALGGATAASAHPGYGSGYDHRAPVRSESVRNQLDELERRVNRNDRRDRVSEREAAGLRREIRDVRAQYYSFARNGIDRREMNVLQRRVDRIRYQLQNERRDWDGRRG